MSSCVSHKPQFASIQDGVRCPRPTNTVIANMNQQQQRAPASESTKTSGKICDQLFSK